MHSASQEQLLSQALDALAAGRAENALALLENAVRNPDASPELHFLLASEYAQAGRFDEALDQFRETVSRSPGFSLARFQFGLLCLTLDRQAEAVSAWEPLEALDVQEPLYCFQRGLRLLIGDNLVEADEWLAKGILTNEALPALNVDMERVRARIRDRMIASHSNGTIDLADADAGHLDQHVLLNVYVNGKIH